MTGADATHECAHIVGAGIACVMADIPLADVKLHILEGPQVAFEIDGSKARMDWVYGIAAASAIATESEPTMRRALTDLKIQSAKCLSENDKAAITRGGNTYNELTLGVLATYFHGVPSAAASKFIQLAEIDNIDGIKLSDLLDKKKLTAAIKEAKANRYALDLRKEFKRAK